MIRGGLFLALASLACAAVPTPAMAAPAKKAAPARPAAVRDWTRTVVVTPEGGYRMGNANAPVKLVEYASLTCPTCARFTNGAKGEIAARVRSGRVSYEFRNYVLNGIDVAATLLARCAAAARFFPLVESLYATQPQWVGKISGLPQAEKDGLKALSEGEMLARIADLGGLSQLAAQAGVTPQRGKACLTDPGALARLETMAEAAKAIGVHGTPSFFINGRNAHAHEWAELEPLIRQAGG